MLYRAYKVVQFSVDIEADSFEEANRIASGMGYYDFDDGIEVELQVDEVEELL